MVDGIVGARQGGVAGGALGGEDQTGGNFFGTEPFEGRYDAMPLSLYMGDGKGGFKGVLQLPAPLDTLTGEVRSIQPIRLAKGGRAMIVGFNNGPLRLLRY